MLSLTIALFTAGLLTILLPCVLPLLPIVLGVSIADRHPLRPLVSVAGMILSFVGFTFLLQVVLSQFVTFSEILRIATFYILLLFGLGFLTQARAIRWIGAIAGGFFFLGHGWFAVMIAMVCGIVAMEAGGGVAAKIQQFGTDVQEQARAKLGTRSLLTSFIIGITMGLVWVPCAGPALGFAFSLVRDQPGFKALFYLLAYGIGAGIPLLFVGYGGQMALHNVQRLSPYTGRIKQGAGVLLILSAIGLRYDVFLDLQTWLVTHTSFGTLGTRIEQSLFGRDLGQEMEPTETGLSPSALPVLRAAPSAFVGLGPWHNSQPLDLKDLRGKIVLIDFWTYSCINCIRTLPYIEALWEKYKDQPFVLIGVHTPEFIFEKSEQNVAAAIKKHGLTYPVAQDNNFGTWDAFTNNAWPAKYLIDAEGNIRYTHVGEGDYAKTDQAIASLLAEMGMKIDTKKSLPKEALRDHPPITRETYLHSRSWASFANAEGPPNEEVIRYEVPQSLDLHTFALAGTWQLIDDERQVIRSSEGEIHLRALAGEVNLVMGLEGAKEPVTVDIEVDGKPGISLPVEDHDLYNLFEGAYGEHDIVLKIKGSGLAAYAFTFGA